MIKYTPQDDLDKTLARLMKKPTFRREWEKSETQYQLGKQIIEARMSRKYSQSELAKRAGTTQAVISRIESAYVSPSFQLINRIAQALGKTLKIRFA
ncbi:MAG: helix-turn-helix transcriptional regulator [bacterium]